MSNLPPGSHNVKKILEERMMINFAYSTREISYLFYELDEPNMLISKHAIKRLFVMVRKGVVNCVRKDNRYYWYIGLPLLKNPEICDICHDKVWEKNHTDVCESKKEAYDEEIERLQNL